MSVAEFQRRLQGARYAPNDLKYSPLWIRRYSQSVMEENGRLPVSEESVKAFSRSLLQTQTPAWQRLQAVRAVKAYRDLVLDTGEPSLRHEQTGCGGQKPRRCVDVERHGELRQAFAFGTDGYRS